MFAPPTSHCSSLMVHWCRSAQKQSVCPKGFSLFQAVVYSKSLYVKNKTTAAVGGIDLETTVDRTLGVQVWEQAALQSEFMVGRQSSDGFDPELCYRQDTAGIDLAVNPNFTGHSRCASLLMPSKCHLGHAACHTGAQGGWPPQTVLQPSCFGSLSKGHQNNNPGCRDMSVQ